MVMCSATSGSRAQSPTLGTQAASFSRLLPSWEGRDREVSRLICLASLFTGGHKPLFYRTLKCSAMCVCVVCCVFRSIYPTIFADTISQLDFFKDLFYF